ncbi:phosphate transport regulator [Syntrophus aciditrophicus SB]|uniref:Phosphate transport regulator n=2 Tax=Syntrophus TaxID=43773 RepID=Q2LTD0_SYNAS|nr:phosphate transport regulator [Syntrophus aciditrophicus SB]
MSFVLIIVSSSQTRKENMMRILPREEKFFDLFEELAVKIEEGGSLFMHILDHYDQSEPNIFRLKEIEHEADVITHETYERMYRTFLTPFDREDIYALVNKMDSILDIIESCATIMLLYRIKEPAPELKEQVRILNGAITKVKEVVRALRNMKNAQTILDACVEINTAENEGDVVLRIAISRLFENGMDVVEIIKWKEIFEQIEHAIDVCEDFSNIAEGIVLKNA